MSFSETFLQELSDRNDIVDVVGSYVRLTKRSGANLFGLCPFHSEKTPSFSVNRDRQIYHCFGCGKGGGVVSFIMEMENLGYRDAVAFLAKRAGMSLPDEGEDPLRKKRERMLLLNRDAARFFHSRLSAPDAAPALEYIAKRGISPAMVTAFGLGYAPDSWDSLLDAMRELGYRDSELIEAGLARRSKSGKGAYDLFRGRLIFPVIDVRGSVIGFSGRIIGDGEPKYLNSPDTPVFSKSRSLFAMNLAKKSKSGYIILAEGNIDVVSLHQAGFGSAVASLGTSLTNDQARLISRYSNEVIIAYDNDTAGRKASARAIEILKKLDLKVRVLRMEGAKDPDEFIRARGGDAFRLLLEKSENHIEYRLADISSRYNLDIDEQKVAYLKEATAAVAEIPNQVERQVYAMRVAENAGVDRATLLSEVDRLRNARIKGAKRDYERSVTRPAELARPADRSIRYENERSAVAEEGLIRLLYLDPALFDGADITEDEFSSPLLARFFAALRSRSGGGTRLNMASLDGLFTPAEISHFTSIIQKPEVLSNGHKALEDYISIIREENSSSPDGDLRAIAEQMRNKKGYGG